MCVNIISKFKIYGERCSGTNYLENIVKINFEIELNQNFGHKHFFGHQDDLNNSDDTLFICIVRDPFKWINSLYRLPHHLQMMNRECETEDFLNNEFFSIDDDGNEIMEDRNIYSKRRYENIFEMRYTKLKYMIECLPKKVKNCLIIRYEDLYNNFEDSMQILKGYGLEQKKDIIFPKNMEPYDVVKIDQIENYTIMYNKNYLNYKEYDFILKYL
jgi:hypothetical protein